MNQIDEQVYLENILLDNQYLVMGPAKVIENMRNVHYSVDHKISLVLLLLVYNPKGLTSLESHCSVTSCKHFHSVNVG